jgi:hypothetical protein
MDDNDLVSDRRHAGELFSVEPPSVLASYGSLVGVAVSGRHTAC